MKRLVLFASLLTLFAWFGCGDNVVSSTPDAGTEPPDAAEAADASVDGGFYGEYPKTNLGVTIHKTLENFKFPGYLTNSTKIKVNTLPFRQDLDMQLIRNMAQPDGSPYRYMLFDISAGWCPPCNQEAEELGLNGTKKTKTAEWAAKGGLFVTVLVQGDDQSTGAPPTKAELDGWINRHSTATTMLMDPTEVLIDRGISPSAFPTNLVIDLKTMEIVAAWYGLDSTYAQWESWLNK